MAPDTGSAATSMDAASEQVDLGDLVDHFDMFKREHADNSAALFTYARKQCPVLAGWIPPRSRSATSSRTHAPPDFNAPGRGEVIEPHPDASLADDVEQAVLSCPEEAISVSE